ncbi:hypothetical protein DBV05_g9727 [Lasiodiplodia theobromae]|uniref:Cupin type-2 domain-containing protein n=1 Tax=Lasiodiplodia theobromae TaxID=45133 RepID=A0A5N5D1N9_9PEZI|nr:hypothetical protein DBV05_g9727 [Lasiodiplodia theobromae]
MSSINSSIGYISNGFPAFGLPRTQRLITGHNAEGKGVFLVRDSGGHHRTMVQEQGLNNILYHTKETPVDLNNDADLKYANEVEPGLHNTNGTVVRMIDFAPNVESPMHRAMSIDYGVVLHGEFELTLDSGETRIMRQGDVSIQRATAHKWKNISGAGTMPGRMLWVLLDVKDLFVNGEKIEGYLGDLASEYEGRSA